MKFLFENKIFHRDLKLDNVLINSKGEIKLCDFGESIVNNNTISLKKTLTGALIYCSPEKLWGEEYGIESDIWSLGILLF